MLKVVGASWYQTVTSFGILVGVFILGMFIILVCKTQNYLDDGKYAATVIWNPDTERYDIELWGQNNNPETIQRGIARAYYQADMAETGWATLEVESSSSYTDEEQAFASGILEGSLSWQHIFWHWENTVEQACTDRKEFCSALRTFLQRNTEAVRKKAKANDKTDPFWHQVNLFYIQLEGIEFGWRYEVEKNKLPLDIPSLDFLWMNIVPDLKDFEKIASSAAENSSYKRSSAAMSLVKLVSDDHMKFLLAHTSSGFYSSMLRIQKKYTFNYRLTGDLFSELVPGHTVSFTSYPASIHSQDDFYQIIFHDNSKATVTGTALLNVDFKGVNYNDFHQKVLIGPRVMAANRLSANGKSWSQVVKRHNSGTGNKQWLHAHTTTNNNLTFWILEQTPQRILSKDITRVLQKQKYWISYGIPYFQKNSTNNTFNEEKITNAHGTVGNISLKKIIDVLEEGQKNVSDIESLFNLMRSPDLALAGRTDLYPTASATTDNAAQSSTNPRKHVSGKFSSVLRGDEKYEQMAAAATKASDRLSLRKSKNNARTKGDSKLAWIRYRHENGKNFTLKYNSTWYEIFKLKNEIFLSSSSTEEWEKEEEEEKEEEKEKGKTRKDVLSCKNCAPNSSFRKVKANRTNNLFKAMFLTDNSDSRRVANNTGSGLLKHTVDGIIDLKLSGNNEQFWAAAGPPFTLQNGKPIIQPFQWSKSPINYLPHKGHSDIWNYKPVLANFVWK